MQPQAEPIEGIGAPSAVPADAPESRLNGGGAELHELLSALQAMRVGDFSVRMVGNQVGLRQGRGHIQRDRGLQRPYRRRAGARRPGGRQAKAGGSAVRFGDATGAWGEMEGSVNTLIDDLLWPISEVTPGGWRRGPRRPLATVRLELDGRPLEGEFLRSADIVNTMIEQLGVFTSEVTRVAREVGDRRQARRSGPGARGQRRLEGVDREREPRWPATLRPSP